MFYSHKISKPLYFMSLNVFDAWFYSYSTSDVFTDAWLYSLMHGYIICLLTTIIGC